MSVAVMTDTNSGLTPAQAKELGVYLLPMPILIDGNAYYEHQSITPKEFYEKMRAKADISTTQPSPADLMDLWEEILKTHDEVVHIPMSSGLSGSHETAAGFAREFNGRVHVVDNHRISVTMRQSVLEALQMTKDGKTGAEIKAYLEKDGLESSIYIAVNTLEYLKKGGRVTAAGAAIGTVLNIKPVLQIQGGKLDAYKKVRGMKAAIKAIIDGLALLGVDAWEEGDDLFVEGNPQLQVPQGLVFESHGDHRLAMTWALVGACGRVPVSVTRFTCVAVSYPDFLADLKGLVK